MRFLVTVDAAWQVTITCTAQGDEWRYTRQMRKISSDGKIAYPAPPVEEAHACDCPFCTASEITPISAAHKLIYDRRPPKEGARQFGHYLFEALIGEKLWQIITETAQQANAPLIELALSWPSSDKNLACLNWEMMRNGNNFIVAGTGKTTVAITRIVSDNDCTIRQILLPPRILFVIGTTITDPIIKPGAEYLGLLKQIKARGVGSIYSRVLENASPGRITRVINDFKPDVVYFICHGGVSAGRGYLKLQTDEEESDPRRYGDQLAALLRLADGSFPPIVVLSACESAATSTQPRLLGAHETSPLAVELIRSGIPIVLGMAGKVSDLACRLFTRQFGIALVEGKSLVTATAEARQATFAQGIAPSESVDWAFPAVFMARNIDPAYAPVRREGIDPAIQTERWIKDYKVENNPVFCGRTEFFQAYYDFFNPDGRLVLAVDVRERVGRLGKTRLLEELIIQAVRDGHVPCPVLARSDWTPPVDEIALGDRIYTAISEVRKIFALEQPLDSQMLLLSRLPFDALLRYADLDNFIKVELMLNKKITGYAVSLALQKDLVQLANDVRKKVPSRANGRVLVLLDAVDTYDKAIDPLFQKMLGGFGLGTAEEPIPVVLAFSSNGAAQDKLKGHLEDSKNSVWLRHLLLNPFDTHGEDMLAYSTILLHPFRPNIVPLVINEANEAEALKFCNLTLSTMLKGIPEQFAAPSFDSLGELGLGMKYLIEARDKDIMEQFESGKRQPL